MKKYLCFLTSFLLILGFVTTASATPVYYNGSGYEVILAPNQYDANTWYSWLDAESEAETVYGGHLATITSADEWAFVTGLFNYNYRLWLGGWQTADSTTPSENWQWVTGETWDWTIWHTGEPNDDGLTRGIEDNGENYLLTWYNDTWNDGQLGVDANHYPLHGYIVETPVPEPSTIALFGLGLVGLFVYCIKRKKSRIHNATL